MQSEQQDNFISFFKNKLKEEERQWLALVIMMMIYADKEVSRKEIEFLGMITALLDGKAGMIDLLNKTAKTMKVTSLSPITVTNDIADKMMEFLNIIAISDGPINEGEKNMLSGILKFLKP